LIGFAQHRLGDDGGGDVRLMTERQALNAMIATPTVS
jgi:hypothetical protein